MEIKRYTADFETCTWLEDETYVWAWAICEIGGEYNIKTGTDLNMFMEICKHIRNSYMYFHNLKFDGEFIISWLLENGFKPITNDEERESKTFKCLISEMGMWYTIDVYFEVKGKKVISKVKFIDSLKIIPFSVDFIASKKCFNLPIQKLEIDYNEYRERDHKLTDEERLYISNDVKIVALALNEFFDKGLKKITGGSNALSDFKKIIGKEKFEFLFPMLPYEVDKDLRASYRGGFTYLNPEYEGKVVGKGVVLDVNSLYPSVMYNEFLPFGEPIFYNGEYERDDYYPLFIQRITCTFKLKKNKIPTIQIKNNTSYFIPNEYLTSSGTEPVALTLTSVDLELFFMQYEVYDLEYVCGWKFKAVKGAFTEYIDKWTEEKIKAGKEGNSGKRTIAKRMLNSLYGKLASSMEGSKKIPLLDSNGIVQYLDGENETRKGVYLPAGAFITSYARYKTITTSQAIKDYSINTYGKDLYCYSDTDSIHCLLPIEDLKQFCDIDDYKLGFWKHESSFEKAKFIRQKCYLEYIDGKMNIVCAGMPKECYPYVTFENFKKGLTVPGKLTYKHLKGGVKLIPIDFTIKE